MNNAHPRLEALLEVSGFITETAALAARSAQRKIHRATRPHRGRTLRPGVDTPLWNELVSALRQKLTRYGDKARLARLLGLPRQRVDDFLTGRRALPDAERTLLLLQWLEAKKRGIDLG
jgi:hypothetical protein